MLVGSLCWLCHRVGWVIVLVGSLCWLGHRIGWVIVLVVP